MALRRAGGNGGHSCQPIGLDKALLVQNRLPPRLMILNKKTGKVEVEHVLPAESLTDQKTVHAQFRPIRMTAKGTHLVPFLKMNKVVEYDEHINTVWTYEIPTPRAPRVCTTQHADHRRARQTDP